MSTKKSDEAKTSFEKFEELTKRLLSVPKEEADTKMEEAKKRRSKKPR